MVPVEERIAERNSAALADSRLQRAAQGAGRQRKHGRGIPAVVGAGDDEVDRPAVLEEVVEADLDARGGGAVDEDPFFCARDGGGARVGGAVVGYVDGFVGRGVVRRRDEGRGQAGGGGSSRRRPVVERLDGLADHVRFADPGALGVREADGDDVPGRLELAHEGVHVGRRVG